MEDYERETNTASIERSEKASDMITSIINVVAREMWELGFQAGAEWAIKRFNLDTRWVKGE